MSDLAQKIKKNHAKNLSHPLQETISGYFSNCSNSCYLIIFLYVMSAIRFFGLSNRAEIGRGTILASMLVNPGIRRPPEFEKKRWGPGEVIQMNQQEEAS